jgi:glycine/D-amino acid oxidase-like deaminating enzyme
VAGAIDDPDGSHQPNDEAIAELEAFLGRVLTEPVFRHAADTCFYTCTATQDYVLDVHPRDPRVVIGAGFSGHGFKLAPLCGRILADLVIDGRSIDLFEQRRAKFSVNLHG